MSNFLDKIKLKVGVTQRNQFYLPSDHITTSDFFRIKPVYIQPTVPGGKYSVSMSTFSRLSPLTNPMYGRAEIVNRAFFVPFRLVMKCWNNFITDTPYSDANVQNMIPSTVTYFTDQDIYYLLVANADQESNSPDFEASDGVGYKFDDYGRRIYDILCALGYKVNLTATSSDIVNNTTTYKVTYNALPLLCFFKIFKDWYANQAYETSEYNEVFESVNRHLDYQSLDQLFAYCMDAMYQKDYFTAAQDNPVVPNIGVSSSYEISDITNDITGGAQYSSKVRSSSVASSGLPTTPSVVGGTGSSNAPGNITQFVIDQLKALTDFLRRNNIVGSKAADRMLARYGVKPGDAALNQSIPFGSNVVPLQISDVMATSSSTETSTGETHTSLLGDYAGKGIAYGNDGFSIETDEYGMIMVISTIQPKIGYVQGTDRFNFACLNRLDFWTPEFDGKSGCQAIALQELKSDYLTADGFTQMRNNGQTPSSVFGFIPRWSELKIGHDRLTGDFIRRSVNSGLDAWHLFRTFGDDASATDLKHNLKFTVGNNADYDRIFAYTGTSFDHFIMIYHFDVKASLPMAKLFDTYEFDGGREIEMEVNGTQMS